MAESVVIVGVGMMTAVGLSAAETSASVRAATMRFTESSLVDHRLEPFTLAEVPDEALPELMPDVAAAPSLTTRQMRMLQLALRPLAECLTLKKGHEPRPGLMLSLPEAPTPELDPAAFLKLLEGQSAGAFDLTRSSAGQSGRAGGLAAIKRASDFIQSGQADLMIAGGVDTYRDPDVLDALDMERRVKSEVHLDGFVPGEGAGFLLLTSDRFARRAGLDVVARLSAVVKGFEDGHLYSDAPYRGDGLAATVSQLIHAVRADLPVCEVYSSMNGESHWAKEWGVAFLRNKDAFAADHGLHHPADCFGDTGAACGPLMVGLAALAMKRGLTGTPALVYCSSDRGDRAVLTLAAS